MLDEEEFDLADDTVASSTYVISETEKTTSFAKNSAVDKEAALLDVLGSDTGIPVAERAASSKKEVIEPTSLTKKIGADMSFEEKKLLRAKRFDLPVVETKHHIESATKDAEKNKKHRITEVDKKQVLDAEPELLPKDEIEKLLDRAKKFGGVDQKRIDELKAMLRKYRFAKP